MAINDGDLRKIYAAGQREGALRRLGLRPAANRDLQRALIALTNPRGDLGDADEDRIAMAMRACPMLDKALRSIGELAKAEGNNELIRQIACAAIDYAEQPAPAVEPEDEEPHDEDLP